MPLAVDPGSLPGSPQTCWANDAGESKVAVKSSVNANRRRGIAAALVANNFTRAARPVCEFMARPGFDKSLEFRSRQIDAPKAREFDENRKELDRQDIRAANRIACAGDMQYIEFSPCYTTQLQLSSHQRNSCSVEADALAPQCHTHGVTNSLAAESTRFYRTQSRPSRCLSQCTEGNQVKPCSQAEQYDVTGEIASPPRALSFTIRRWRQHSLDQTEPNSLPGKP